MADNRRRVREAVAGGFITKPFQVDELVTVIRESLPQVPHIEELKTG
jgi:hypothetical protein